MHRDPQHAGRMAQVYARAWSDDRFRRSMLADAGAALRAEGMPVPAGLKVTAVENTAQALHLVLPPPGAEADALADMALVASLLEICAVAGGADASSLSDAQLEAVAGAGRPGRFAS